MTTELGASIQQLEATRKELATERQSYFYLNRALETAVARLQRREQARWRRALSLLLTILLSAAIGAASFGVFLWLYYRGVIALG